jgi:hypothetical protein
VPNVECAQRVEHTLAPVASMAAAELRNGAREAMRFEFNMLLFRTAGRIMLRMLKIALPFVVFQVLLVSNQSFCPDQQ